MKRRKGPLAGIKVANFSWIGVGPFTIRYLGNWGATVVKVESHTRPDILRMMLPYKNNIPAIDNSPWFANTNSSSYGVSLNLDNAKGREIAWKLVKWCDVMAESFAPGTIARWGLDYKSVRKVKPDIVYMSTTQLGQTGPQADFAGWGYHAAALAGFTDISGWPDHDPAPTQSAYTDFIAPRFNAVALLAALDYRRRTGKGQFLDLSQREVSTHFLATPVMDYLVNGRIVTRNANRLPYAAPHAVYPCRGDDRWCAITVFTDEEWAAFCVVIGKPELMSEPKFSTIAARKQNEEELDRIVGEWTRDYTAEQVEVSMQDAGVAACVVESVRDLFEDPQIKHRGFFKVLKHAAIGEHVYRGHGFKLSKTPDVDRFAGPALGQHNEMVFRELLHMTDDEVRDALVQGAVTTEADLPEFRPTL